MPTPTRDPTKAWTLETGSLNLFTKIIVATADTCEAIPLELLMYVSLVPRHRVSRHPHRRKPIDTLSPPSVLNHQFTYKEPYNHHSISY